MSCKRLCLLLIAQTIAAQFQCKAGYKIGHSSGSMPEVEAWKSGGLTEVACGFDTTLEQKCLRLEMEELEFNGTKSLWHIIVDKP